MTTLAAVGRRVLPRGWGDLAKQLAIWFGFLFAYQAARGIADRNPPKAFDNGLKVIGFERHMHGLIELSFQRFVDSSQFLMNLASWTYWNSEFTVVALALLWIYLRRHEAFIRFRNASLHAADALIVGLVLFAVCRNWFAKAVWALWPAWVWFSVMATGNHFWLDVLAGVVLATIALAITYRSRVKSFIASLL